MVAIKDFEMPSCCIDCRMYAEGQCDITHTFIYEPYEKAYDCPLVEVRLDK